jgi:methyl-accepting chemotaxis protein
VHELNDLVTSIVSAADQVASSAGLVSDSSVALSHGATEQASTVEELTASVEEISSQTGLNAQNAEKANSLALNAKTNADEGNRQMKEMLSAMDDINASSGSIYKIIKVIEDIAFQTNILALNAAVEAARAGQHGKGFAVVAEEVRTLAARSSKAASETADMIEDSIRKVDAGTKIAKDTAGALNQIVEEVENVATLVNSIAVASKEQALGIEQINQGIIEVSQVVQTNAATSEESAAASEELSGQASQLKEIVSVFKLRNASAASSGAREAKAGRDEAGGEGSKAKISAPAKKNPPKISLSDNEFGKY